MAVSFEKKSEKFSQSGVADFKTLAYLR